MHRSHITQRLKRLFCTWPEADRDEINDLPNQEATVKKTLPSAPETKPKNSLKHLTPLGKSSPQSKDEPGEQDWLHSTSQMFNKDTAAKQILTEHAECSGLQRATTDRSDHADSARLQKTDGLDESRFEPLTKEVFDALYRCRFIPEFLWSKDRAVAMVKEIDLAEARENIETHLAAKGIFLQPGQLSVYRYSEKSFVNTVSSRVAGELMFYGLYPCEFLRSGRNQDPAERYVVIKAEEGSEVGNDFYYEGNKIGTCTSMVESDHSGKKIQAAYVEVDSGVRDNLFNNIGRGTESGSQIMVRKQVYCTLGMFLRTRSNPPRMYILTTAHGTEEGNIYYVDGQKVGVCEFTLENRGLDAAFIRLDKDVAERRHSIVNKTPVTSDSGPLVPIPFWSGKLAKLIWTLYSHICTELCKLIQYPSDQVWIRPDSINNSISDLSAHIATLKKDRENQHNQVHPETGNLVFSRQDNYTLSDFEDMKAKIERWLLFGPDSVVGLKGVKYSPGATAIGTLHTFVVHKARPIIFGFYGDSGQPREDINRLGHSGSIVCLPPDERGDSAGVSRRAPSVLLRGANGSNDGQQSLDSGYPPSEPAIPNPLIGVVGINKGYPFPETQRPFGAYGHILAQMLCAVEIDHKLVLCSVMPIEAETGTDP